MYDVYAAMRRIKALHGWNPTPEVKRIYNRLHQMFGARFEKRNRSGRLGHVSFLPKVSVRDLTERSPRKPKN